MKKILLIVLVAALSFGAKAQTSLLGSNGYALDTVNNTGSKYLSARFAGASSTSTVTIAVDIIRISGTLAGTLTPVVSNNGTTFYSVASTTSRDTAVTITNAATAGYAFDMPKGWLYYGVLYAGSGTMSASVGATAVVKK